MQDKDKEKIVNLKSKGILESLQNFATKKDLDNKFNVVHDKLDKLRDDCDVAFGSLSKKIDDTAKEINNKIDATLKVNNIILVAITVAVVISMFIKF